MQISLDDDSDTKRDATAKIIEDVIKDKNFPLKNLYAFILKNIDAIDNSRRSRGLDALTTAPRGKEGKKRAVLHQLEIDIERGTSDTRATMYKILNGLLNDHALPLQDPKNKRYLTKQHGWKSTIRKAFFGAAALGLVGVIGVGVVAINQADKKNDQIGEFINNHFKPLRP